VEELGTAYECLLGGYSSVLPTLEEAAGLEERLQTLMRDKLRRRQGKESGEQRNQQRQARANRIDDQINESLRQRPSRKLKGKRSE
jgi:hypothetical protein